MDSMYRQRALALVKRHRRGIARALKIRGMADRLQGILQERHEMYLDAAREQILVMSYEISALNYELSNHREIIAFMLPRVCTCGTTRITDVSRHAPDCRYTLIVNDVRGVVPCEPSDFPEDDGDEP